MHRPVLCLVTGAAAPLAAIADAVAGGADWVQLRERALEGRPLLAWVEAARDAARAGAARRGDGSRLRVLVNRRLDVALAAGVEGVHLGFDAMDPAQARAVLALVHDAGGGRAGGDDAGDDDAGDDGAGGGGAGGDDAGGAGARKDGAARTPRGRSLVGVSAHAVDELPAALRAGADYAHLAPIFAPLSKPAERAPLGLAALAAARRAGIPVLAQGGIDADNAGDVIRAGAAGIAVTGAVLLAPDPGAAARTLRVALDAADAAAAALAKGSA